MKLIHGFQRQHRWPRTLTTPRTTRRTGRRVWNQRAIGRRPRWCATASSMVAGRKHSPTSHARRPASDTTGVVGSETALKLTAHPTTSVHSTNDKPHHAQSELFHRRSSFLVDTHNPAVVRYPYGLCRLPTSRGRLFGLPDNSNSASMGYCPTCRGFFVGVAIGHGSSANDAHSAFVIHSATKTTSNTSARVNTRGVIAAQPSQPSMI